MGYPVGSTLTFVQLQRQLHLEAKDFIPMNAPVVVQVETCRMKSLQLGSGLNRGGHLVQTKIERAPIPASAWRIGAGLLGQYRRGRVKWIDEHHFSPFVRRPCCKSAQVSQVADTPTFLTAQGIQLDVPSPYAKVRREMTSPRADDHAHRGDLLIREGELVIADRVTCINLGLGTAVGIAMYLLDMPNPLLWGVMAGLLTFIPYLGHVFGIAVVVLAAALTFDDLGRMVLVGAIYWALAIIEGSFVSPMILGQRLAINPVVLIIGLMLWGWIWGIGGVLLAVPLLVAFKIFCDHVEPLSSVGDFIGK